MLPETQKYFHFYTFTSLDVDESSDDFYSTELPYVATSPVLEHDCTVTFGLSDSDDGLVAQTVPLPTEASGMKKILTDCDSTEFYQKVAKGQWHSHFNTYRSLLL